MTVVGLGIDLVEVARVRRMIERWGERALRRMLTPSELAYVLSRPDPAPHVAARLAAKEAVYKAFQCLPGTGGIGWRDIEVSRDKSGRPAVRFRGNAARIFGATPGLTVQLSLTHSRTAAGAVAILQSG